MPSHLVERKAVNHMKVVVASDSFKGSLTSRQIGEIVKSAAEEVDPCIEVRAVAIADGGEGTVDAFFDVDGEVRRCITVKGPEGEPVDAGYCVLRDGAAVIEVASVVGLAQNEGRYDPLRASSFGVGQVMRHAMLAGCGKLIVGLGGSCTTDGGIGLMAALGFAFLDENGKAVEPTPRGLARVARVDISAIEPLFWSTELVFACDVANPFHGPLGAAHVFAPQKGATPDEADRLDEGLQHFAQVIRQSTGIDLQGIPGTGAAGGMCAIPLAYGDARICSGSDLLLQKLGFDQLISDADLIITGEGRLDAQSLQGKVPLAIGEAGKRAGKRVIAVVGSVGPGLPDLATRGIAEVRCITPGTAGLEDAIAKSAENYRVTAVRVLKEALLRIQDAADSQMAGKQPKR